MALSSAIVQIALGMVIKTNAVADLDQVGIANIKT
jgi:hypothetical protein